MFLSAKDTFTNAFNETTKDLEAAYELNDRLYPVTELAEEMVGEPHII